MFLASFIHICNLAYFSLTVIFAIDFCDKEAIEGFCKWLEDWTEGSFGCDDSGKIVNTLCLDECHILLQ